MLLSGKLRGRNFEVSVVESFNAEVTEQAQGMLQVALQISLTA